MVVPRPLFPKTLSEFQTWFTTEQACVHYLAESRWPDGYVCPRCGHDQAYELTSRPIFKCKQCHYQVSATAGTVLHGTRLSMRDWFSAAYLDSHPHTGDLSRSTATATRSQTLRNSLGAATEAATSYGPP